MGIKYYYKSQVSGSIFQDVTSQISVHAFGGDSINNMPSSFQFQLSPYIKSGSSTIYSGIQINIGDTFLIVQDDSICIAFGNVYDNGKNLIGWDHINNIPNLNYDVKCEEKDFSAAIIESFDYTSTSITSILDEIMLYVDDSLYHPIYGKYLVNFDNYNIAFSLEKKTARQALTELCEQINCFWVRKVDIVPDSTEVFKVYTYLKLSDKSGVDPNEDSTWYEGIVNKHVRKGTIENPIISNRSLYPVIAGESKFKLTVDPTIILNHLDLSCKVFENSSATTYSRHTMEALPNTFDYQLNAYADDIKYISMLVKTNVLSGSTSTVVRVPSNFADNDIIKIGDKAYFPDSLEALEETSFFTVNNVNVVNTTYTELTFDDLGFTPASGDVFEIISNIEIFRDETNINYASQGVLIDCDKKAYAKLKFLDLSEPPTGQIISAIFNKVKDYNYPVKNQESLDKFGLKYKELKLDDSIVLTRTELYNLSSKLLTLKPKYDLNLISRRYGLAEVGMSISVKIDNFVTEKFILNENNWEFLGANDKNNVPCFAQSLSFSTEISNPEKVIAKLERQKKRTASNSENLNRSLQLENIKVNENITWSFNPLGAVEDPSWTPDMPLITSISDVNADGFTINYTVQSGVAYYVIDVTDDSDLIVIFPTFNNKNIGKTGSYTVTGLTGYTNVYAQMRGVSAYGVSSFNTSRQDINLLGNLDYTYSSYTKGGYWNFNEGSNSSTSDLINTNQIMTINGSPTITADVTYGNYYIDFNTNSKYAVITDNSDLLSTDKYTFKILFNLNQVKNSGIQTLFRKNDSFFGTDAEWDFTFINGVLYITMYDNGGLSSGWYGIYTTFTFTAGVDYSLIYSIDLTNNLFTLVINQTTVTFTVRTDGASKSLSAMTAFNNSNSYIEIARYFGDSSWNGDYILKRFEILPDIYLDDTQAKAESALFGL